MMMRTRFIRSTQQGFVCLPSLRLRTYEFLSTVLQQQAKQRRPPQVHIYLFANFSSYCSELLVGTMCLPQRAETSLYD